LISAYLCFPLYHLVVFLRILRDPDLDRHRRRALVEYLGRPYKANLIFGIFSGTG
jgi:hypothetical protein